MSKKLSRVSEGRETKSLTTIAVNQDRSWGAEVAKDNFEKQIEFVQVALDYSDIGISRIKVSDLPELVSKAQNEITVGKMRQVLNSKKTTKKEGIVKRIIRKMQGI